MCKGGPVPSVASRNSGKGKGHRLAPRRVTFRMMMDRTSRCLEPKVTTHVIEPISDSDGRNVYSSKQDLWISRFEAKELAKKAYLMDKSHSNCTYGPLIRRAFSSSNDFPQKERRLLLRWTYTEDRRGLERSIVTGLMTRVRECRYQANSYVLEFHAQTMANHGCMSHDVQVKMANTYRELALPSTQYARLMADMDAGAVQQMMTTEATSIKPRPLVLRRSPRCHATTMRRRPIHHPLAVLTSSGMKKGLAVH